MHTTSDEDLIYYPLQPLIGDREVLVLCKPLGIITYLAKDEQNQPRVLGQAQFSPQELAVLLPVLTAYPQYCSDAALWLARNRGGQLTDEAIAKANERLQEAKHAGVWDFEMRPVRNLLSRARFRLRDHLGLDIRSVVETGYMLISARESLFHR